MFNVSSNVDMVLDSLSDHAVLALDGDGYVRSWNKAAFKIKGYTESEIIGRHFSLFYTEQDREAGLPMRGLHTARDFGRYEHEGWRVRKDQSWFWGNVIIQPCHDDDGELAGFVKVTRDISDHLLTKKLQEELRQSQKLELIGQLTGGIVHDFNNLLMTIESTFELIQLASTDPKIIRYLAITRGAIDRSRTLTGQLLAFSRKQVLDPKLCDINDVIVTFDTLLNKVVDETVTISWQLAPVLPRIMIDSGNLQSALMNLVINARDAMPQGGEMTISTEMRAVSADEFPVPFDIPTGAYIAVTVSDTGTGMSADVLEHCVEPFYTTKEVGKGTGLGLSQCFGFARQSGGTLEIRSVMRRGTTISMLLPVNANPAAPQEPKKRVLVVEDDQAVRELATALLHALGHAVIEAGDGPEALSMLKDDPSIDVVFSDMVMPKSLNGIQLLQLAQELRPGLQVILTSGYTHDMLQDRSDLPADIPFLRKPYTIDDLRQSLRGHQPILRGL